MLEDNGQGGSLPPGGQPMDPSARARLSEREGPFQPPHASSSNAQYDFHSQAATPQQQLPGGQPFNMPAQQSAGYQLGRGQSPSAFSMSGMAGALPDYQSSTPSQMSHHDQQRFVAGTPTNVSPFQSQQYTGQSPINPATYPIHPPQYSSTYQQIYSQIQPSPQSQSAGPSPIQSSYPGSAYFSPQQQPYMFYQGQYGQQGQSQHGVYPAAFGSGPNQAPGQQPGEISAVSGRVMHGGYSPSTAIPYPYGTSGPYLRPGTVASRGSSNSSTGSIPSTPRGPPRKPKQSGHALWVGNLPSGTVVSDLKDHFSKDATRDIESVFLISKSNCAFVNYRSEAACAAAMTRFHDSRFQGVRLVCRLRRSSASSATPGAPTGPAALMPAPAFSQTAFEAITQNREVSSKASEEAAAESARSGDPNIKVKDKYFVMKSLTVEDMELSIRNSIWATQSHNEDALNKAYNTAENVYLIFSANKSGEYFGYARMASPITDEAAAGLDWAPRGEAVIDDPDVPRSIPTPATEFAPKGRIIDDSARGTIFWEADPEDEDLAPIIDHEVDESEDVIKGEEKGEEQDEAAVSGGAQSFGKPFKIEWLSTNRLPFYRTRGLRNPWNANREVKIARDGTELETSVGRRLVQMFQKVTQEGPQPPVGWVPGRPF